VGSIGSGTGTYGFSLMAVPTFAITISSTVEHGRPAGAGIISAPYARQLYTFSGSAGQSVYLRTLYTGAANRLGWRLMSPTNVQLAGADLQNDLGRFELPATGTYTIEVGSNPTGTGTYGFTLTAVQ
jgi:hypothetical protein